MTIAVVCDQFHFGGLETHIAGLCRFGRRLNHSVYLITGSITGDYAREVFGDNIYLTDCSQGSARSLKEVIKYCKEKKISLIHAHPFNSIPLAKQLSDILRIPFVITLHGKISIEYLAGLNSGKDIVKHAKNIFCVSEELVKPLLGIYPSARYSLILNSIDIKSVPVASGTNSGKFAYIGRLDDDKIEAAKHFIESFHTAFPEKEIVIFGDGTKKQELIEWIEIKGIPDITIIGFRNNLFSELDNKFEGIAGMCRSFLDGAAMGFPAILSGYDGIKGLIPSTEMQSLAYYNFSGRERQTISPETLKNQYKKYQENPESYNLRPWIFENANEENSWKQHFELIEKVFL